MAKKLIDKSIPRFLLVGVGNTLLSMAVSYTHLTLPTILRV